MFGVLAVNKPSGLTSRDVVNHIQKIIRPIKVGHTGTLDPLASGVLLIAVGPATRLTEFSHGASKDYEAKFELGVRSDTLDCEGQIERLSEPALVQREGLQKVLPRFLGRIEQTPPKFSAIQVGGRRAYDLARAGKDFEMPTRQVEIHSLKLQDFEYPHFSLFISCSTGTYIRTLGCDMARFAGSDAVMTHLQRTRIGGIRLGDCAELSTLKTIEDLERRLLTPSVLLESIGRCELDEPNVQRIRNGIPLSAADLVKLALPGTAAPHLGGTPSEPAIAAFSVNGDLVAVLQRRGDCYRSLRVFQNANETNQPKANKMKQSPES